MNKKSNSIDGFQPRNRLRRSKQNPVTEPVSQKATLVNNYYKPKIAGIRTSYDKSKQTSSVTNTQSLPVKRPSVQSAAIEKPVEMSNFFDLTADNQKKAPVSKFRRNRNKISQPKAPKKRRRIIRWVILVAVIVIGVVIFNYLSRASKILNVIGGGNIIDMLKTDPLKTDEQGRTNFLIFGTESNNTGSNHGGPLLTDSLMMVSFDSKTNKTSMISVPRDLWVKLEKTCFVGNRSKINTVYQCGSDNGKDEKAGAEALGRKMAAITGLEMHYYLHLNFQAVEDVVNAIGGVEIVIESPDPRGIYDISTGIKYKNGPTGLLDGKAALNLIRARNSEGGYGLSRSNYDREDNQRKMVAAIANKMITEGIFNDFDKMVKIFESLGDNLRTNVTMSEIRSVAATFKTISAQFGDDSMNSISMAEVTKTGNMDGQSVVLPISGFENYSAVKQYIQTKMSDPGIAKEAPTLTVLNGSDTPGLAQKLADALSGQGFKVIAVANAPDKISGKGRVYQKTSLEKPKSLEFIKKQYGFSLEALQANQFASYNSDFIIVAGPDLTLVE